ncbi:type II CRISPR RNA-guided endonuclease Cas9 [Streptococcus marimammalium]|uniref:type II CRISPR RNA-guided endonuclease Cas9 n=1 Tax=Streptococcus marimammalium TaxID=269666 RepID=UPI0003712BBD|nr:type II CRISPR RNA-guided endonuclease Cas9 [Streptococcus marimammalium]
MNGKILGLDIGVASVGVGIIDSKTGKVLHASSRIFPSANADNNKDRRSARQARRLLRRKQHRVKRLKDLFDKYNLIQNDSISHSNVNPYEARVKGLSEKLTIDELYYALLNMLKHRGISYLDDAEDDGANSSSEYKKSIEENRKLLKSKTPGEIQLERLNNYGQLRGNFIVYNENNEKEHFINVFSTSDYKKEAQQILETQQKWHDNITNQFIEDFIKILTGKRKYYIGPGNESSRTDYGIYRTNGETLVNIFKILIGTCAYTGKVRAAKASYTAQEYNLLNDLNNLTYPTETGKLSQKQKEEIVIFARDNGATVKQLLKFICQLLSCDLNDIKGFRKDAKDNPEISTFEAHKKMKKGLETVDFTELTREEIDTLAHILTINTDKEAIEHAINMAINNNELPSWDNSQITELVQLRKTNSTLFGKGWHSFSIELMKEIIPELYATDKEQMSILSDNKYVSMKSKLMNRSQKTKYIDEEIVTDEIYNPVVAKSVRQTVKIINLAIKKYGEFDKIVIEMPRDKNEEEERKNIKKYQNDNNKEKDSALQEAASLYNGKDRLPHHVFNNYKDLNLRIRLWYQQEGRCLYTGQKINIQDLIDNRQNYEIDHILPLSLSFDDSISNKVLVTALSNQEKGQRTPFQAIREMKNAWTYPEFKKYVLNLKRIGKTKLNYLLTEEDINKIEVKKKFIARNLVDTRYASRVILNTLQDEFKRLKKETKIAVVRGKFTAHLRYQWRVEEKNRDTYHHHAIDALIIAASANLKLWKKMKDRLFDESEKQFVDMETGEIISIDNKEYKELVFQPPFQKFTDTLNSKELWESILFSYQVDSKVNRKVSDATIYGTRKAKIGKDKKDEDYVLGKIKDIYSLDGYDKFIKQYNKDKSKFLMYQKDPKTFENVLEVILRDYPDSKIDENGKKIKCNPFEEYRKENGLMRKWSKKENGPEIKQLKYYDTKLGNHIDITPDNSRNKVVLQSLNPWRTDVYFNPETMTYQLMGIRYSDLSYIKSDYGISIEKYNQIKKQEGIAENAEFKFTLYKNDLLLVKDTKTGEEMLVRFLSRTLPNKKNYVELKPYEKNKFDGNDKLISVLGVVSGSGRFLKSLAKPNLSLYKVKTNVLGNLFYIKKEELTLKF